MGAIFEGIRVVELAEGWTGAAICGRFLAECGAEVVKVEPPEGDPLRRRPPLVDGESRAFHIIGANKRGVALDLATRAGQALLRGLILTADVVLDGYSTGKLAEWGLGEEDLRAARPSLVYAAVSTFGRSGPLSGWLGGDLLAQATSGMMSITGFPDDPPTRLGVALGEHSAGTLAALSVIAALILRLRTGRGQAVDVAAQDCLFAYHSSHLPVVFLEGKAPPRLGFRHPLISPWDRFKARDQSIIVCTGSDAQWDAILKLIGREDLIGDPGYATPEARVRNVDEVYELMEGWIQERDAAEVLEAFEAIGIPSGPIMDLPDMLQAPQFQARKLLVEVPHPRLGTISTAGSILKMSETPGRGERCAPDLGQDTEGVLGGLKARGPEVAL